MAKEVGCVCPNSLLYLFCINRQNPMKLKAILTISILAVLLVFPSCKKENLDDNVTTSGNQVPLVFTSLTTKSYTIALNASADVDAVATGSGLTYSWQLDLGTLIGSGSTVLFNGCCTGIHNVTCTVTDEYGNTESKTIAITVNP